MNSRFILAILFTISTSGCMTMPPGSSLGRANPIYNSINNDVWISEIKITDPSIDDSSAVEESLALNILEYIRQGNYFKNVNLIPGQIKEEDLILSFQFDHYQLRRTPHPAYFPLAMLTLTLYIWFGGPIYNDVLNISGQLTVKSFSGHVVSNVEDKLNEKHSVSLWSSEYLFPSGIKERTQLIKRLLDKSHAALQYREMN